MEKFLGYIPHPYIFFVIAGIILVFGATRKNNNFFDSRAVFSQYFSLFKDCKHQLIIYFGVPLLIAIGATKTSFLTAEIIGNIIIVLSIFLSMFFAMLSILVCFTGKKSSYVKLLRETFNTIVFECVVSIMALLILIIIQFVGDYAQNALMFICSLVAYYLIVVVVLNIFIVIKRLKVLFDDMNN